MRKTVIIGTIITLALLTGMLIGYELYPNLHSTSSDNKAELNSNLILKINETAVIDDPLIVLILNDVVEDTRCPIDIECLVPGDIIISVTIFATSYQDDYNLTLNKLATKNISFLDYVVEFKNALPEKELGVMLEKSDYIITLFIGSSEYL